MKPHTLDYARRLLREMPKRVGNKPDRLLERSTYANPTFLELYFSWLDDEIYRHPRRALPWARIAPNLALATPKKAGPKRARRRSNSEPPKDWTARLVRARAILGGCYRAIGDYDAAEESYGAAVKLCGSIPPIARADTYYRLSTLRACQDRSEEALELASEAVDTLRGLENVPPIVMGQAILALGYAQVNAYGRYKEGITCFGEALTLAGTGKKSRAEERLHETSVLNMAMAVSDSGSVNDQHMALLYIRQAHMALRTQKRRTSSRPRLQWIEALVLDRLGSHGKALRLYRRAREGFEVLGMPWEAALAGLDLAALLHLVGDLAEMVPTVVQVFDSFRRLSGAGRETLATLSLWVEAVRMGAREIASYDRLHAEARRMILAGVGRGGSCCRSKRRP